MHDEEKEINKVRKREIKYEVLPYLEKIQEEREKHHESEIKRLEQAILHNTELINLHREETTRRFNEINQRFASMQDNMNQRFGDSEGKINQRFADADKKIDLLREEMNLRFGDTDKKIDRLRNETNERFVNLREEMNQRFGQVDKRFEDMQTYIDKRFNTQGNWTKFTFGILSSGIAAILIRLYIG